MEKINVKQLEKWSTKTDLDKINYNQEIRFEATDKGGFSLINQENEIVTFINVSKNENQIVNIQKQIKDNKNLTVENSTYYLNGILKNRVRLNASKVIQDTILGEIKVSSFVNKIEMFNENGTLQKRIDFNKIYTYNLNNLISHLQKNYNVKNPNIIMVYPSESLIFNDIIFNKMIEEERDLKRDLPYWGIIYKTSDSNEYNCLLFNGKTGELVKEERYKIGTTIDHNLPTPAEYFKVKKKEFGK